MPAHSLNTLGSSLQAMPVAMIFTQQLLVARPAPTVSEPVPAHGTGESLTVRATKLTTLLKDIPGYTHGGLND
jgi:hypothetical protein